MCLVSLDCGFGLLCFLLVALVCLSLCLFGALCLVSLAVCVGIVALGVVTVGIYRLFLGLCLRFFLAKCLSIGACCSVCYCQGGESFSLVLLILLLLLVCIISLDCGFCLFFFLCIALVCLGICLFGTLCLVSLAVCVGIVALGVVTVGIYCLFLGLCLRFFLAKRLSIGACCSVCYCQGGESFSLVLLILLLLLVCIVCLGRSLAFCFNGNNGLFILGCLIGLGIRIFHRKLCACCRNSLILACDSCLGES